MTASTMGRLEASRDKLSKGSLELEDLASELSGAVETVGSMTLATLSQYDPRLPALVAPLEAGEASAPYSSAEAIHLLEVTARREPSVVPFEQVREAVTTAFVERHGQRIYQELHTELLQDADYQLFEQHLDSHLSTLRGSDL